MKPTIMVNQKTPTQIWNGHFISVEKPALVETCEHVHSGSTVFRPTATQLVASEGLWRREMTESRLVSSFKRVPSAPMLLSPLKKLLFFFFLRILEIPIYYWTAVILQLLFQGRFALRLGSSRSRPHTGCSMYTPFRPHTQV